MQNRHALLFIILLTALTWACAQRQPLPPVMEPTPPPIKLAPIDYQQVFREAEKLYNNQLFDEALEKYTHYVDNQPLGSFADTARKRIGDIHVQLGDPESARNAFEALLEKHPQSPWVPDTMIAILEIYDREDDYEGLIRYSFEIPARLLTHDQLLRKESLLGDAYLAMASPVDAFYFYSLVYDQSTGALKDSSLQKLRDVLPYLNTINTIYLLDRLKDDALRGYLLYHLGLLNLDTGRTDDALTAFSELVGRHPEHELIGQAKALIREIFSESIASPHTIGCLLPLSGFLS